MTEEITDAAELHRRLDGRQGFLASRKAGRQFYTVHDLSAFCDAPVNLTPGNDSAYYADDTNEFTRMWSAMDWVECGACMHVRLRQ